MASYLGPAMQRSTVYVSNDWNDFRSHLTNARLFQTPVFARGDHSVPFAIGYNVWIPCCLSRKLDIVYFGFMSWTFSMTYSCCALSSNPPYYPLLVSPHLLRVPGAESAGFMSLFPAISMFRLFSLYILFFEEWISEWQNHIRSKSEKAAFLNVMGYQINNPEIRRKFEMI